MTVVVVTITALIMSGLAVTAPFGLLTFIAIAGTGLVGFSVCEMMTPVNKNRPYDYEEDGI